MASNAAPTGDAAGSMSPSPGADTPSVPPPLPPSPAPPPASTPPSGNKAVPITQAPSKPAQSRRPAWVRQLPNFRGFNEFNETWQLLNPDQLKEILKDADPETAARVYRDVEVLDHEVLRLFRRLDYEAAKQQNRYRRVQLEYAFLALAATVLGSIMALTLESTPWLTPILGIGETVIALLAVFISNISNDEPPQQLWLQNRLRAEFLRREYFRYLMRLSPYGDITDDFDRETLLAKRAADINRGFFPEQPQMQEG